MKAVVRTNYCKPEDLSWSEIPYPQVADDEVLVRIYYTSINRTDCANLMAKPFIMRFVLGLFKPKKTTLGTDFSGDIVELGKDSKCFKVGDQVFGFKDIVAESQAEYAVFKERDLFLIPVGLEKDIAAASLEGAHYAYSFFQLADIQAKQKIFINGATGAIGSALLQFVKTLDVHVTASCRTEHMDEVLEIGADKVVDYTQEDFTKLKDKYDVVFDAVGKSTFGKCKPVLSANGIYISSELGPFIQNVFLPVLTRFTKKKVFFPIPKKVEQTIPFISKMLATGKFKPLIDRSFELDDISEAYQYVMSGQKKGNVLLKIS
ncbi:MAG: NAD(P)-dependent alcohol dehydrogenase [Saprospiraceae bacterium]|nr:NAD(P)-dependent alcohol dehydrogenase [Saprospiraceae bacterium]